MVNAMSPVRVRFAPSPTGMLHVGGARTALFNWLFARHHQGTFILRVEDTDDQRNTPEANEAIFSGLTWLGLDWDEGPNRGGPRGPYRQSERTAIYEGYLAKLQAADLAYTDADGSVRFRCPNTTRAIPDLICGETVFAGRTEPDMTVRRANGSFIFHFVNVVDDIEMGVTHVIRGEDHLPNTPRHLDLYEAFGVTPPHFAHIPLILNANGSKMSKRDEGASVAEYQSAGYHPEAVLNYLALLGWSPKEDRELFCREDLIARFTLGGITRGNAMFNLDKCGWLSGQYFHVMEPAPFRDMLLPYLTAAGLQTTADALPDSLLLELRTKVRMLSEAVPLLAALVQDDFPVDAAAVAKLRSQSDPKPLLDALATAFAGVGTWQAADLDAAIGRAAEGLGIKKGALMFPCRIALTGQSGGFGLTTILEQLGRERALDRLTRFS
ncbi:MAG: glutamyl-tRNA synthetase [Verrucomicrobia bacterium]|jgi:glutamyl-tRNA synthetase|nr:MAG: glutamyl-tRNA synthetase [Verrucomicrobiota bacterium]